jgi:hypothetical protein
MTDPNVDIIWPENATAHLVARRSIKSGIKSCKVLSQDFFIPRLRFSASFLQSSVTFVISEALVWLLCR